MGEWGKAQKLRNFGKYLCFVRLFLIVSYIKKIGEQDVLVAPPQ